MTTLSRQSQAIITAFGHQPGVTADQLNNLQTIINGSPALVDQINAAVAAGHLRHIAPLTNAHAGGEYNATNKTMSLPLAKLTSPPDISEITFVLGHELQHGPNRTAVAQARTAFVQEVTRKTQEPGGRHDYTAILERSLGAHRNDESGAEISGWNAVVSALKTRNPTPTIEDIYNENPDRMSDFIDKSLSQPYTYNLKPNLTLNTDMTMTASAANLEAMGKNYFDAPLAAPYGIGHHGDSDYRNFYAASDIGYIVQMERYTNPQRPGSTSPTIAVDMQHLKLSEAQMERNGIDLGSNHSRMVYRDLSTTPASTHYFDHTTSGSHAFRSVPITAPNAPEISQDITHPQHLGNPRYQQALHAIEHSPNIPQGTFTGERLHQAAANVVAASLAGDHRPNGMGRNERLDSIDFVVFNKDRSGLIPGQGELGSPTAKLALLPATQDNATSLAVASQQVHETLHRSQTQSLEAGSQQRTLSTPPPEVETSSLRR